MRIHQNVTFPFTITRLDNNKTYYVIVTEVCAGAETIALDETSATPTDGTVTTPGEDTSGIIPEPVDVTSVVADVAQVTLTWSAPSDFAKTSADYPTETYRVCWEQGANPDSSSPCYDVGSGEGSYIATGLTGGQEYCFGVQQRKDVIGESAFGTTMCATPTPAPTAPNAPTGVTATPALCAGGPAHCGLIHRLSPSNLRRW